MKDKITNILMAGVGGQGIIMASNMLSEALLAAGRDVKKSEVHGMAQRGGSVTSHVRFGRKVFSPLIRKGEVDILYSLELLETLRYTDYLKKETVIILNDYRLNPPSVSLGAKTYPEGIPELVRANFPRTTLIDGVGIAREVGNPKTVSTVILGHLSLYIDMPENTWADIMSDRLPSKILDVNLKAFHAGREIKQVA
ncbi:MAG: indolepyruvate oxidoreductase subunit beta [Deltaproteobacteria bacterium]|nr:indolepyruvate oxidoreductase subunit beta [Candidatus Zymogenaceae bacterium]